MNYFHYIYPMMRSFFASIDGYTITTSHYETWHSISHARKRNQRNKSQRRKHK